MHYQLNLFNTNPFYWRWLGESGTPPACDEKMNCIQKKGIADSIQDLAERYLKDRFIEETKDKVEDKPPSGETLLSGTEEREVGETDDWSSDEALLMEKDEESLKAIDEEEISAEDFEWTQDQTLEEEDSKDRDHFMSWLLEKDFAPKVKLRMNCSQGVVYYISLYDQSLKEKIKFIYSIDLKETQCEKKAVKKLYLKLPLLLGFSDPDDEVGPFPLKDFNTLWNSNSVKPGSIISFGDNTGGIHLAIATKDKKMRSLWKKPGTDVFEDNVPSHFGKYPPNQVVEQVITLLSGLSEEFTSELGIAEVFYISNRFCYIFN